MNTIQTKQAYSEIDAFIELLNEEDKKKIPQEIRDYFKKEKDVTYKKEISVDLPIDQQNLKEETLALIAVLYLDYICEDNNEKAFLNRIYQENENEYQEKLRQKYNPDDIFKRNKVINPINNTETAITIHKDNIIKRLIKLLKKIFHRDQ